MDVRMSSRFPLSPDNLSPGLWPSVLLLGKDALLLEYRSRVLQSAHLQTFVMCGQTDLSASQDFPAAQAAILCHTLSRNERWVLTAKLRAQTAGIKVLALNTQGNPIVEPARYDAVIDNLAGPALLIRMVRRQLVG